ncbi:conserved hypothetical protein [Bradyrhizobium sp. ORS 375]|nr:conserved hypothetical protein [Bradyrhizobium sp. ORS 375]
MLVVTSGACLAGTPLIDARQNVQSHRIYNGIASGRLTYPESQQLIRGQLHVQKLENRAKADGVVTPFERARINVAQSVQGARIFWKKHN